MEEMESMNEEESLTDRSRVNYISDSWDHIKKVGNTYHHKTKFEEKITIGLDDRNGWIDFDGNKASYRGPDRHRKNSKPRKGCECYYCMIKRIKLKKLSTTSMRKITVNMDELSEDEKEEHDWNENHFRFNFDANDDYSIINDKSILYMLNHKCALKSDYQIALRHINIYFYRDNWRARSGYVKQREIDRCIIEDDLKLKEMNLLLRAVGLDELNSIPF